MKQGLANYSMRGLCCALEVSRSGYYAWAARPVKAQALLQAVSHAYAQHGAKAGAPSLHKDVQEAGFAVCERTVGRKLARLGLRCRSSRKFKHTTDSKHKLPIAANLLDRRFTTDKPNQVWVGDITYIRTGEGWLYLAVIIDLHSRQVVGWQMGERMTKALVCDALDAAFATRGKPEGVMVHSDQGKQYASHAYRKLINDNKGKQSMSRKANCWDDQRKCKANAVAESFFATLKKQAVFGYKFETRRQAKMQIFEYIESYYNRVRRHSSNGWLSPVQFENLYYQSLESSSV